VYLVRGEPLRARRRELRRTVRRLEELVNRLEERELDAEGTDDVEEG
jgi:hypothetical protein